MTRLLGTIAVLAALALVPAPAVAQSLKLADSFRIGNAGVLCTAQFAAADPALTSIFDNGYRIVCRDAAAPVGKLYVLRAGAGDPVARLVASRADGIACGVPAAVAVEGLAGVTRADCRQGALAYAVYLQRERGRVFAAEGLAGYGSALRLGLRSIAADRAVPGRVEVAVTEAGDPAAFARVQAGRLDPAQALAEGYVRNNAANYAESAAFFDTLAERSREGTAGFNRSAEYLANQALQQSNLGAFAEAEALFGRAEAAADPTDPLVFRMLRNTRAMHQLNRGNPGAALAELQRSAADLRPDHDADRLRQGHIDVPVAQKLNSDSAALARVSGIDVRLTLAEKLAIYDAQALYLQGVVLQSQRRDGDSRTALTRAIAELEAIRGGRVTSLAWLKAAAYGELAMLAERGNRPGEARQALETAVALLRVEHPGSAALLGAEVRLAALLARQGETATALAMFGAAVRASPATPGAAPVVRSLFAPYFALLAERGDTAAGDFFDASQILARPGVAQTQAVLARELSGGNDAAAGLFRQSLTLSRDIVRVETAIGRASAKPVPTPDEAAALAAARAELLQLGSEQTALLAQLSEFPRFRVLSNAVVSLSGLRAGLQPGEAYYKLVLVGDAAYALFASRDAARLVRVGATTSELGRLVGALRDSIVVFENARPVTYPFDAAAARRLYRALFDGLEPAFADVRHLIFEPDGPLLQLPINLLIARDDGLAAYARRTADANADADADPFDMTGIAWLGRDRIVSTAVSPQAFLDNRAIPASTAARGYLGLGGNAPPPALASTPPRDTCDWPLRQWSSPIDPAELRIGAAAIGGRSELLTGAGFSDTAFAARRDLDQFRILHFATHGLVTAPRPECPARPALLTSFGDAASDGLLSFREIFDLKLDADTVILSACDTAGTATAAATREAGIATGGNYALDGLVRAFVGAGARTVIASHWPVPDSFDATKTLISGLFDPGQASIGEALRQSEVRLMDAPATSHPYYWSGFAIIGDAAKPLAGAVAAAVTRPAPAVR